MDLQNSDGAILNLGRYDGGGVVTYLNVRAAETCCSEDHARWVVLVLGIPTYLFLGEI